jgi:hypothetical protein
MTRDMQIGLLLAVGFLALVGGVLYYRIEHPDELEHFWNGGAEVAQNDKNATGSQADLPDAGKPPEAGKTPGTTTSLPAVPTTAAPNLESSSAAASNPTNPQSSGGDPVLLTSGQTSGANPPVPSMQGGAPSLNFNVSSPPPALAQQGKPVEQSHPAETNAGKIADQSPLSPALANATKKEPPAPSPSISEPPGLAGGKPFDIGTKASDSANTNTPPKGNSPLNGNSPPLINQSPLDDWKKQERVKQESPTTTTPPTVSAAPGLPLPAGGPPSLATSTPTPTPAKPEERKDTLKPSEPPANATVPLLTGAAPSLNLAVPGGGANPEASKPIFSDKPANTENSGNSPSQPGIVPPSTGSVPPLAGSPPAMEARNTASPAPAATTEQKSSSIWNDLPKTPETAVTVKPAPLPIPPEVVPPVSTGLNLDNKSNPPPAGSAAVPALERDKPASNPNSTTQPSAEQDGNRNKSDEGPYREYAPPRSGLGRPVPESVLAFNDRRWSDSSTVAAPIIPSSTEVRGGNSIAPTVERRVIQDATVSSTRAVQGETFSSLSQRAYGSEQFADALAAYNRESGMVEADQPAGNQLVLLPSRFELENRFGHLLRKPVSRNPAVKTAAATNAANPAHPNRDAPGNAAVNGPSYRVRAGEQLFDVAKLTLGDGYRWAEIYSLNKELLRDSTELRAEMILRLPADAKVDKSKPR